MQYCHKETQQLYKQVTNKYGLYFYIQINDMYQNFKKTVYEQIFWKKDYSWTWSLKLSAVWVNTAKSNKKLLELELATRSTKKEERVI